MNLKIQHRHLEVTDSLQRLIDRQSRKLQKILPTFDSDDLDLHVNLEKLPRGKQYHTVLVLTMPQSAFRVEEVENNASTSILRAFEELRRRIKKFKSQLNRERFWQKQPGSDAREVSTENTRELENAINQHLDQIENYIRRELSHLAVLESIPLGVIQVQPVVDDVFLEVSANATTKPERVPLPQWMFQIAREKVRERINQWQQTRSESHLEERVEDSVQWEDEVQNFYQPDEVLRLEDLLVDENSASPEEVLTRDEIQQQVQKTIARLPDSIRESFILFALEGFNSDEVAMITGKTSEQVIEDVEKAREELRQWMEGRG